MGGWAGESSRWEDPAPAVGVGGAGRCVSLRAPNPIHCHHHAHTMPTVGVYGFYNDAARRVAIKILP